MDRPGPWALNPGPTHCSSSQGAEPGGELAYRSCRSSLGCGRHSNAAHTGRFPSSTSCSTLRGESGFTPSRTDMPDRGTRGPGLHTASPRRAPTHVRSTARRDGPDTGFREDRPRRSSDDTDYAGVDPTMNLATRMVWAVRANAPITSAGPMLVWLILRPARAPNMPALSDDHR